MPGSLPEFDNSEADIAFDSDGWPYTPSLRLPEAMWAELMAIVIGAGGCAKRMAAHRLSLESTINFGRTEPPKIFAITASCHSEVRSKCAATAAAANALLKALEDEGELGLFGVFPLVREMEMVPEFQGNRIELFATQLKIVRDRAERGARAPIRRLYRKDRDDIWGIIISDWKYVLKLPVTTTETAPLLKFIQAISREFPWLKERDLEPPNIRAYLRKWEAKHSDEERQKGGKIKALK